MNIFTKIYTFFLVWYFRSLTKDSASRRFALEVTGFIGKKIHTDVQEKLTKLINDADFWGSFVVSQPRNILVGKDLIFDVEIAAEGYEEYTLSLKQQSLHREKAKTIFSCVVTPKNLDRKVKKIFRRILRETINFLK